MWRPRTLVLGLLFTLSPNSDGRLWQNLHYEVCMAVAGENDWECERKAFGDPVGPVQVYAP